MRTIALLLVAAGVASAGTLFKWNGENNYYLDSTSEQSIKLRQNWEDTTLPPLRPPGNFTNQTLIDTQPEESIVKIKATHAIDVGYSGEYDSAPADSMVWNFQYTVKAYGKVIETITVDVAGWYELKFGFTFNIFDLDLLHHEFLFAHPWMILDQKINNNIVKPFDMKMRCSFTVNDLLSVNLKVTDRLRANFNKQLDGVAHELVKFVASAFNGGEYVEPTDPKSNIANPENYYPTNKEFVFGRQFLTNNDDGKNPLTALQHQNNYTFGLPLFLIRLILGDKFWNFSTWTPINFWIFNTNEYAL